MAICRAASEANEVRWCLDQQFLLEDHGWRGLVEQDDFMARLQFPQVWLRARCTIHIEHFVRIARAVFRPHRFACTAASVGDEEFVPAPDHLVLILECLQQRLRLELTDLPFQGLLHNTSLFFEERLLLLGFYGQQVRKISSEVRDTLQIFLVKIFL